MIDFTDPFLVTLLGALITTVVLAAISPLHRLLDRFMHLAATLARSWTLCLVAIFVIALVIAIIPSLIWSIPLPYFHDEFAYLLQGDTFAHFRLTNPSPPIPEAFETFHVLVTPSYAGKFPVAAGMSLAVGYWLHLPIVGIWLSGAAGCAAIAWALRAFVTRRWALLGGLLCTFYPIIAWWNQSYWGGGAGLLGGAILVGAVARAVHRTVKFRDGIFIGIGLAILATSRPLEGLLLTVCMFAWMSWQAWKLDCVKLVLHRIAPPLAIVSLLLIAFMGYYNRRVTGNVFSMPYIVHARQYMVAPLMFGQQPNVNQTWHHEIFEKFFSSTEVREYARQMTWHGFAREVISKWWRLLFFFIRPPTLVIPLIALLWPLQRGDRGARLAAVICILLPAAHVFITPWLRAAYMGPIVVLLFVGITIGMRQLDRWRIRRVPIGRILVVMTILTQILADVASAPQLNAIAHVPEAVKRDNLVRTLKANGEKNLVFVRYGPHHDPAFDYVYNAADINNSPIVFVRSRDDEQNQSVLDLFPERRAWEYYCDDSYESLHPYSAR